MKCLRYGFIMMIDSNVICFDTNTCTVALIFLKNEWNVRARTVPLGSYGIDPILIYFTLSLDSLFQLQTRLWSREVLPTNGDGITATQGPAEGNRTRVQSHRKPDRGTMRVQVLRNPQENHAFRPRNIPLCTRSKCLSSATVRLYEVFVRYTCFL